MHYCVFTRRCLEVLEYGFCVNLKPAASAAALIVVEPERSYFLIR
jgi:hypothetical protein